MKKMDEKVLEENSPMWTEEVEKFVAHGASSARTWTRRHFIHGVVQELKIDEVNQALARALTRRKLQTLDLKEKVSADHITLFFKEFTVLVDILYRLGATAITMRDPGSPKAASR